MSLMYDRLFRKAESESNSHVHHYKTHLYKVFVEYQKSGRIKWIFIFNIEEFFQMQYMLIYLVVVNS